MERLARLDPDRLVEAMLPEVQRTLRQIAAAVNAAPDGKVIDGSEREVRDLLAALGQQVYQTALQQRVDATEASFSPSGQSGRPARPLQGAGAPQRLDPQRPDHVA